MNGRLPPEDGSDRRETLGKCVSGDLQLLIFRRRRKKFMIFSPKKLCKINKLVFWRSYDGLSVSGRSVVKSHYLKFPYFIDTSLGEGVNDSICVSEADLDPTMILIIWYRDLLIM